MDKSGVVIDGAVPRNPRERCQTLFDYLVTISEVGPHQDLDPAAQVDVLDHADEFWHELENELLREIEEQVTPCYVVALGEHTPGDVIVLPWDEA